MPFKKISTKEIINEKRKNKDFDEIYIEIEKEYTLTKKVVEAKNKWLTQKNLTDTVGVSQ